MTIQEAYKSGKSFRRKGWPPEDIWFKVNFPTDICAVSDTDDDNCLDPTIKDILANDWETK